MFWDMMSEGRKLIVKSYDILLFRGVGWAIARDNCSCWITVEDGCNNSRGDFFNIVETFHCFGTKQYTDSTNGGVDGIFPGRGRDKGPSSTNIVIF